VNLHLKTKVYYFKKSLIYLKNYKRLVVLAVSFSLLASLFDGFSIGALIPFLQSLTSFAPSDISTLPIFQDLQQKIIGTTKEEALVNILIFALGMIILRSIFWRRWGGCHAIVERLNFPGYRFPVDSNSRSHP